MKRPSSFVAAALLAGMVLISLPWAALGSAAGAGCEHGCAIGECCCADGHADKASAGDHCAYPPRSACAMKRAPHAPVAPAAPTVDDKVARPGLLPGAEGGFALARAGQVDRSRGTGPPVWTKPPPTPPPWPSFSI